MGLPDTARSPEIQVLAGRAEMAGFLKGELVAAGHFITLEGELPVGVLAA